MPAASSDELRQLQLYITVACRAICRVEADFAYIEGHCIKIPAYNIEVQPSTYGVVGTGIRDIVRTWNVIARSSKETPLLLGPAHRTIHDTARQVALYIATCLIAEALGALEPTTPQQFDEGAAA